jgi:hypothetical protein
MIAILQDQLPIQPDLVDYYLLAFCPWVNSLFFLHLHYKTGIFRILKVTMNNKYIPQFLEYSKCLMNFHLFLDHRNLTLFNNLLEKNDLSGKKKIMLQIS